MRSNRFLILCILLAVLFLTNCGSDTGQSVDGDIEYDGELDSIDGDFDAAENEEISSTFGSITGMALLRNSNDNSGINVLLLLGGTIIQQLETGFEGDYEFSEIDPGNYTITASWGDFTVERVAQTEVQVLANSNALAADLMLTPTGNLDGQVTLDGVAAGVLGVQIYIPGHSYQARSDDDGNYILSHIPVGVYQLCAEMDDYNRECLNTITVLAGETVDVDVIDLEINDVTNPQYAGLSGNVTLLMEDDHSQISVSLAGTAYATTTDSDGNFILLNIPPGVYDIVFDAPAGSGFESGATLYDYRLFVGIIDDTLPDMELHYGRNVAEFDFGNLVGISNDDLGLALLVVDSQLTLYEKDTGSFTVLAKNALNSTDAYTVNSDWTKVVYKTKSYDLYSIPITGGTAVLLGSDVSSYKISPDWTKVVYKTSSSYLYDLYSIPIMGGTAVLLGSDIYSYEISPDWTKVVYKSTSYSYDLYSVSIMGGTAVLLGSDVNSHDISPDWTTVVYKTSSYSYNLYSVSILDGTAVLLGSDVYRYEISPDWTTVVYRISSSYSYDLYSVSILGGTAVLLGSGVNSYEINPDWTTVVYMASSYPYDLYSIPITGGTAILLESSVVSYQISPDSTNVIYAKRVSYSSDLYSIPITGGTAVLLGSAVGSYTISPDSAQVLYKISSAYDLYSIPTEGGTAVLLGSDVKSYEISPDSTRVLYQTANFNPYDVYSIPIEGGTAVLLGSDVYMYKISPDWTKIVYQITSPSHDLYLIPITGGTAVLLASNVDKYKINPDWTKIIYQIEVTNSDYDLYTIPVVGGTAVLLGSDVRGYEINPDWTRVLYRKRQSNTLHSIPFTGGAAVVLGSSVSSYKISSDWTYVMFFQGSTFWRVSITGEYKQVIAFVSNYKTYFFAFDDFSSVFYTRKFGADTTYYSENTYRFNLAEFTDLPL